jgi:hypothetical protein
MDRWPHFRRPPFITCQLSETKEIPMMSRVCLTGLGVMLVMASPTQPWAATFMPQVHAPAQFRIDFTRPGGLPGAPRDIAAARELGGDDQTGQGPTLRRKRHPRTH